VATYHHQYDTRLLDAGSAAAGTADDDPESVGLLRDDSHTGHRLSFGSVPTFSRRFFADNATVWQ